MKINNTFKLIIAIIVSELAGIIGSVFTTPSIAGWYSGIVKPALNPPAWVFGPVWTTLFALMGIAAFLVWKKGLDRRDVKIALGIFLGQLVLNTLWSIIFFGLHSPGGALVEIVFLWLAILATIVAFYKISRPAAWLLVPYILWVSFAGYLNYSIWQLNTPAGSGQVACTQEAKLCPDGSYVGRTGPKCEFAACPGGNNDLWKTTTSNGITFQYPETLLTTYINTQDWPPQVQVLNEPFTCTEAGEETARAGKTEKRLVDNREYCRTSIVEGAAGSIYTQYAYAFPLYSTGSTQADRKTAIFTFTTRATQCGNYDEAERKACEGEREAFDLDSVVDRMARSIKFR
ncbi:MAG: TspO/MBR family protein [Victivallaceae bacterium]